VFRTIEKVSETCAQMQMSVCVFGLMFRRIGGRLRSVFLLGYIFASGTSFGEESHSGPIMPVLAFRYLELEQITVFLFDDSVAFFPRVVI